MLELSIFCDESGGMNGTSRYRIVTLVFHDQARNISPFIKAYEDDLANKELPDIPFHAGPLMYGKGAYETMDLTARRRMFSSFAYFQSRLPYRYKSFVYRRDEVGSEMLFLTRLKRDLVVFLADNLEFFQSYEHVKIYYDDGQQTITNALHAALEYQLSKQALLYKVASPIRYRLYQVADYLCTLELTATKYDMHEITATDEKFFGLSVTAFKRDYLKKTRKKAF